MESEHKSLNDQAMVSIYSHGFKKNSWSIFFSNRMNLKNLPDTPEEGGLMQFLISAQLLQKNSLSQEMVSHPIEPDVFPHCGVIAGDCKPQYLVMNQVLPFRTQHQLQPM
jgi:hypothetical protein